MISYNLKRTITWHCFDFREQNLELGENIFSSFEVTKYVVVMIILVSYYSYLIQEQISN